MVALKVIIILIAFVEGVGFSSPSTKFSVPRWPLSLCLCTGEGGKVNMLNMWWTDTSSSACGLHGSLG